MWTLRIHCATYRKFYFYNYCVNSIQRTFCYKPHSKISTLFENAAYQEIPKSQIYSVLSPLGDVVVSIDDFRILGKNLHPMNTSFWPVLLDYSTAHDCPKLRKSLTDYILNDKCEHSIATLIKTLKSLVIQKRYTDFRKKKVFQYDLFKLLARTPFWRETLEMIPLLETLRYDVSSVYTSMCLSALKFDFISSVFECMELLIDSPHDCIFYTFFDKLHELEEKEAIHLVSQLFQIMHTHQWIITYKVAKYIQDWFTNLKHERWVGNMHAKINRGYMCSKCNQSLSPPDMSQFPLSQMADTFHETVIKGTNIENLYLTATSDEVITLKQFLDSQTEPLDCIIDFLNLMNIRKFRFCESSGSFVAEVIRQINKDFNLRRFCLVSKGIGIVRRPEFWNPIKMLGNQLGISVHKFCTNAKSEDDAFLLYMAMKSGPQCYIVSNDEYNNHRYSSGPKLGKQISRWQSLRQLVLQPHGRSIYQKPSKCDLCVHGSLETGWHIPYYDGYKKFHTAVDSWLCLRRLE
ncbi:mitochondrial ribonuclease P protein 3 [Schistosoma japonicum]|nr:mitochondrial ribonuclease P protein 3 [Schistosoma japonicum]